MRSSTGSAVSARRNSVGVEVLVGGIGNLASEHGTPLRGAANAVDDGGNRPRTGHTIPTAFCEGDDFGQVVGRRRELRLHTGEVGRDAELMPALPGREQLPPDLPERGE
jgi:hypothetical protein